ncbi:hypothetical protein [Nostoc sp.]
MFINCEQLKIGSIPDVQKRLTAFAFSYMIQVRLAQPATGIAFVTTQSAIALTRHRRLAMLRSLDESDR